MFKIPQENLLGLKIKDYTFLKVIGEGNYGRVYEVFHEKTLSSAAAKAAPKELFKRTPKLMELMKTEIRVLKECRNENVVRYVDNFMSEKSVVIVMELCDGGELQEYLDSKGRLTENEATTFLKQIINGFKGLHEIDAMHRDFKAANVLLHQNVCKIADLGFAKQVKEEGITTTILGTGLTKAPEVHQEKSYGRKADIWSVGIVYYQLIYGDYPFKGFTDQEIYNNIQNSKPSFEKVNISDKARDFIERCLTVDPKKRISWKEVYSHPLILEEEQIKYGLTSSIRIKENQGFYESEGRGEERVRGQVQILEEKAQRAESMDKLREECEERTKLQGAVKEWQTQYLNRRNNIMFIFKYIVPSILAIYKHCAANHAITLFIMCKKAYHDLRAYHQQLALRHNFLQLKHYFPEFTASKQYKEIGEIVEGDLSLIRMQTGEYCKILPSSLNAETREELDIEVVRHSNWGSFVMDTIDCYENELIGNLDGIGEGQKRTAIRLIEGLHYYRTHGADSRLEEFDKYVEGLSYEQAEILLRERWLKRLTECQ